MFYIYYYSLVVDQVNNDEAYEQLAHYLTRELVQFDAVYDGIRVNSLSFADLFEKLRGCLCFDDLLACRANVITFIRNNRARRVQLTESLIQSRVYGRNMRNTRSGASAARAEDRDRLARVREAWLNCANHELRFLVDLINAEVEIYLLYRGRNMHRYRSRSFEYREFTSDIGERDLDVTAHVPLASSPLR